MIILIGTSCLSESEFAKRPLVPRFGSTNAEAEDDSDKGPCLEFYDLESLECLEACPDGSVLLDEAEIEEVVGQLDEELDSGELPEEVYDHIIESIDSAEGGVCAEGLKILRPSGQVFVNRDFCACKDGKPDIVNDCANFCSSTSDKTSTLYGSVRLGYGVESHKDLGSLFNWCYNAISGSDLVSPGCFLKVDDGNSSRLLDIGIPEGSNSFTANIETLSYNTVYIATIVETESGSNATSSSFQIYRHKSIEDTVHDPLKIMPISQYSCISRSSDQQNGALLYKQQLRSNYYFPSNARPPGLPPNASGSIFCHDINKNDDDDSSVFDRLEIKDQHFALWDRDNNLFSDLDGDGELDVHNTIIERLRREAGVNREGLKMFNLLTWPNFPEIKISTGTSNTNNWNSTLGYYMIYWINPQTGLSYCPTQEHYNGRKDPILDILKEVVGVDTEGIYFALSESINSPKGEPLQTVMFIREGILKKVWFYFEDNKLLIPDNRTVSSKTIQFYYPVDLEHPYIRKSTQKIYTVRHPDDIGKNSSGQVRKYLRSHDRRFGCVPAVD